MLGNAFINEMRNQNLLNYIIASVKISNPRSLKYHQKIGFAIYEKSQDYYFLRRDF